jgi:hypothetical protein
VAFHLGPTVRATLLVGAVELSWDENDGTSHTATLHLPRHLDATLVRGSTEPPLGWYSGSFGTKVPTTTVLLTGPGRAYGAFKSVVDFAAVAPLA